LEGDGEKEGDPLIQKNKIWWFGKIWVFLLNEWKQVAKWTQTTWHYCPLDTDVLCGFLVARHPRGVAGEDSKGTHRPDYRQSRPGHQLV